MGRSCFLILTLILNSSLFLNASLSSSTFASTPDSACDQKSLNLHADIELTGEFSISSNSVDDHISEDDIDDVMKEELKNIWLEAYGIVMNKEKDSFEITHVHPPAQ